LPGWQSTAEAQSAVGGDDCPPAAGCEPEVVVATTADQDGEGFPDVFDMSPDAQDADQADADGDGVDDDCDGVAADGLDALSCGVGAGARTVPSCVAGVPQTRTGSRCARCERGKSAAVHGPVAQRPASCSPRPPCADAASGSGSSTS
jgi:hypothetical protein